MPAFKPFANFESAATEALKFLHDRFGFGLWMVTRTEGEDWIVLVAEDQSYGVKSGKVLRWADSFCSRMVQGFGPCVAPSSKTIPAYNEAPIGAQIPIGAYIGIPLRDADGELFGTLCAIDPSPQDPSLEVELPLIRLIGRLLSTCIVHELIAHAEERTQLHSELRSLATMVDVETGALLPEAWKKVVAAEEVRCQKLGYSAYVIRFRYALDLSEGVTSIATVAKKLLGGGHVLARMNSNEFLVLLSECSRSDGDKTVREFAYHFESLSNPVKITSAVRDPRRSLEDAIRETAIANA